MFREIIKKRLEGSNITLTKLGNLTGINTSTLSSFLAGYRTISNKNLEKIMSVLRLTLVPIPGFKFGYDEKPEETEPVKEGELVD